MIRVLYHEQPEKGPGGSRVSLLNLVRGLGDRVEGFFVGDFPPEVRYKLPPGNVLSMASSLWPPPANASFGRVGKTIRWMGHFVGMGLRLASAIRRLQIDIVHGNNDVNSNAPAILAAMLTRRPYVGHLRGNLRPWRETRWLFRRVDHFIAIAQDVKDYYARKGLLDGKPVSVVFNGVDVEDLARRAKAVACRRSGSAPRVAMFGRMDEFKGHEYFLRAASEVMRQRPDMECEFVVNGPVPESYEPAFAYYRHLLGVAESLGVGGRVRFAGPYADVAEVMGQSDVCVCCSPYSNFGRILFEAMACGVAFVAFDSGGMREAAVPEENCLVAANRDPVALAGAIIRAVENLPLRERLVTQGRQTALRLFDFRANAQNVLRIYEGLLAQRRHAT